jgi:hypothetical protein
MSQSIYTLQQTGRSRVCMGCAPGATTCVPSSGSTANPHNTHTPLIGRAALHPPLHCCAPPFTHLPAIHVWRTSDSRPRPHKTVPPLHTITSDHTTHVAISIPSHTHCYAAPRCLLSAELLGLFLSTITGSSLQCLSHNLLRPCTFRSFLAASGHSGYSHLYGCCVLTNFLLRPASSVDAQPLGFSQ